MKQPLKSLVCNFDQDYFVAQLYKETSNINTQSDEKVESKISKKDSLIKVSFNSLSFNERGLTSDYHADFEIILPEKYPVTLPMQKSSEGFAVIVPESSEEFDVRLFDHNGNLNATYKWPEKVTGLMDIENFRIYEIQDSFIVFDGTTLVVLDSSGRGAKYKQSFSEIRRVITQNNLVFVQTNGGIYSFKL